MPESSPLALPDQDATEALGARLARLLRAGDCILLEGPIGAGKTTLVRALLRAASGDPALDVPSPTFTLVQTYELSGLRAHHFDLWRLDGPAALVELGWEDAMADVTLVEWPERLGDLRPPDALTIALSATSDTARLARLAGWPDRIGALA